jgi:hypothetical protein
LVIFPLQNIRALVPENSDESFPEKRIIA